MWGNSKDRLEVECMLLEEENALLETRMEQIKGENGSYSVKDRLEKNQALLSGKEICMQHMELSELMKDREDARKRNPLLSQ